MPSTEQQTEGVGCTCGWPLDPCSPKFATGPCDRERHESHGLRWIELPNDTAVLIQGGLSNEEKDALGAYLDWFYNNGVEPSPTIPWKDRRALPWRKNR